MKTTKNYSSKEDFESKNPYVLVEFMTFDNRTVATIQKSFTNKKTALNAVSHKSQEVMTRKQYYRNALMCM